VDTIGAGDSFQAALLFALHALGRLKKGDLESMSQDEMGRALSFAANCAAVTCTRAGADPPRLGEVSGIWDQLRGAP
jgi:fructokinase